MNEEKLKYRAAAEAMRYVQPWQTLGVGSGSTVLYFIEQLAAAATRVQAVVSSSQQSSMLLRKHGLSETAFCDVAGIDLYVDGADESNRSLQLVKGGGGALAREKILAYASEQFICIAHQPKLVNVLGSSPLPLEVIPMACQNIIHRLGSHYQADGVLRRNFTTDNGNYIVDVHNLSITDPEALEGELNQLPGVVCNGIFALRAADLLLLSAPEGVKSMKAPAAG